MKRQKACAFIVLFAAGCLHATAQNTPLPNEPDYNKPKIFAGVPDKLTLRLTDAEALLNLAVGTPVSTTLATGFMLSGTVVSKSAPEDESLQSVVIKAENRQGATFVFTRIKNEDGSFRYRGGMLSKSAGDALEIAKDGATYVLRKKGYYDLINE